MWIKFYVEQYDGSKDEQYINMDKVIKIVPYKDNHVGLYFSLNNEPNDAITVILAPWALVGLIRQLNGEKYEIIKEETKGISIKEDNVFSNTSLDKDKWMTG